MANRSLLDLTERTATANSDLIHVNSDGTDYKQTKDRFLKDIPRDIEFSTTDSITSQVDALAFGAYGGAYFGRIQSYGHQAETGVPYNDNYTVEVAIYNSNNKQVVLKSIGSDSTFLKVKYNGTWETKWRVIAGNISHSATASSGVSIARFQCYESGRFLFCSGAINITSAKSTQDVLLTIDGVSVPSTTDIVGITNTAPAVMIILGNQIKANMSISTGYVFFNFTVRIS